MYVCCVSYVGSFVNDKKDGYGVCTWPDGRVYKGNWSKGKPSGKGEYTEGNKDHKDDEKK